MRQQNLPQCKEEMSDIYINLYVSQNTSPSSLTWKTLHNIVFFYKITMLIKMGVGCSKVIYNKETYINLLNLDFCNLLLNREYVFFFLEHKLTISMNWASKNTILD